MTALSCQPNDLAPKLVGELSLQLAGASQHPHEGVRGHASGEPQIADDIGNVKEAVFKHDFWNVRDKQGRAGKHVTHSGISPPEQAEVAPQRRFVGKRTFDRRLVA